MLPPLCPLLHLLPHRCHTPACALAQRSAIDTRERERERDFAVSPTPTNGRCTSHGGRCDDNNSTLAPTRRRTSIGEAAAHFGQAREEIVEAPMEGPRRQHDDRHRRVQHVGYSARTQQAHHECKSASSAATRPISVRPTTRLISPPHDGRDSPALRVRALENERMNECTREEWSTAYGYDGKAAVKKLRCACESRRD